ncbi:hypothetical protein FOMG_07640 [Fusarium oxysporum f. sp. melonis 26406]|uniref:Uncharacterized protein n=1 Tax=Fusarium oxysporum f. sp. melonis 26406 TaxID=1089452 RepID=X0B6Y6_FUSOX|nr:hypothetical protein FOMG_07640 [Fusarium oxysporum f. sp. melonis 26406]
MKQTKFYLTAVVSRILKKFLSVSRMHIATREPCPYQQRLASFSLRNSTCDLDSWKGSTATYLPGRYTRQLCASDPVSPKSSAIFLMLKPLLLSHAEAFTKLI